LRHEIFLFLLQFAATLIRLGQIFYENQTHRVNLPKMGICFTTIVGQSDWLRHCYWLHVSHTASPVARGGIWWAKPPKKCTKPP